MLKSMTGYGRGESSLYNRKIIVEIKSVNHRYNDITIKLPRLMTAFEDFIRKTISKRVFRGKTDIYVSYETLSKDDIKISINEPLADAYVLELKNLIERYNLRDDISLSLIARFPDVISIEKNIDNEYTLSEIKETLEIALNLSIDEFLHMREQEGEALKSDIMDKLDLIKTLSKSVSERAPQVTENYAKKLTQKVRDALQDSTYDEMRLITEVTIFTDKACIDEEITRLNSHLEQMKEILMSDTTVGRKLDFLVQEMNREVNTIGSKASDLEITKLIVDIKSEVEKIREQVQNIE